MVRVNRFIYGLIIAGFIAVPCISCDEQEFINDEVTLWFATSLPPGEFGSSPKGIKIQYIDEDNNHVYDSCKYVGKAYYTHALSGKRCYLKATSEHWCEVVVLHGRDTLFYNKGYQIAVIDEIY